MLIIHAARGPAGVNRPAPGENEESASECVEILAAARARVVNVLAAIEVVRQAAAEA
jgi:hypothetical protein